MTFQQAWDKMASQVELVQVHSEEMEPLFNHVLEFEQPTVVEIGSAHGASSMILAEAAKQKSGCLICIDSFPEDYYGQEKFGDYARREFHKNILKPYHGIVELLDMPSSLAAGRINGLLTELSGISVLFVDGDHSYEGVKSDCELYLPMVNKGGYVAFHDYNNPAFAGVKKAADEQSGIVLVQSAWDLVIFKKL